MNFSKLSRVVWQYVDDLVEGLIALMEGDYDQPVNLGSPDPITLEVPCYTSTIDSKLFIAHR